MEDGNDLLRPQTGWNLRDDDLNLFWPSWLLSAEAWMLVNFAPVLCWILFCSSPFMNMHIPPKPLHEYAYTFSLRFPQFCCLGRHCSGKDPWCSPYLLQEINPSFSCSLIWLRLLARHPPRGEPNFWVTIWPGPSDLRVQAFNHCSLAESMRNEKESVAVFKEAQLLFSHRHPSGIPEK